jgi:DNA-binding transcriptional LysR family regulator
MIKEEMLNLTYVKYFCDAVRLEGISAAAKVNFVTQSAVSQGLLRLEEILKVSLMAHHPNVFRLTPEGELFYSQALNILRSSSEIKESFFLDKKKCMGPLEFASTFAFALNVIPKFLKMFSEQYPEINVSFSSGYRSNILQRLKLGISDIGILPAEESLKGFEKIEIYKGTFKFFISTKIKRVDEKKLRFILGEANSPEIIVMKEAYFKKFGNKMSSTIQADGWEILANLVSDGFGIGYLPDYIALRRKDHLKEYDLGLDPHPYSIHAIYPKGMKLRKSSEIFLSYFLSEMKT